MATEEFKILAKTLLENYIELQKEAKDKGINTLTVSFKDYLDFYISYMENVQGQEDDEEDDDDYEDEGEEDDGEEEYEVHESHKA